MKLNYEKIILSLLEEPKTMKRTQKIIARTPFKDLTFEQLQQIESPKIELGSVSAK